MSIIADAWKRTVVVKIFKDKKTAFEVIKLGKTKVLPHKNSFHNDHLTIIDVVISAMCNLTLLLLMANAFCVDNVR